MQLRFEKKDKLEREMHEQAQKQEKEKDAQNQRELASANEATEKLKALHQQEQAERERLQAEKRQLEDELSKALSSCVVEREEQAAKHERYKLELEQRFGQQQQHVSQMQTKLLEERARLAEERLRNEEEELELLRHRVDEKDAEMQAVIREHSKELHSLSTTERAKQERMIQQLQRDADDEKEALTRLLSIKEDEVKKTQETFAEQEDIQDTLVSGMTAKLQRHQDADDLVTKKLLSGTFIRQLEARLAQPDSEYCLKEPGSLDLDYLIKCGMKLKKTIYKNTDTVPFEFHMLDLWVSQWQHAIAGADFLAELEEELPTTYTRFNPKYAFWFAKGSYHGVREEDENIPGKEFLMAGRKVKNPDKVYSAAFVKDIRKRYGKKADGIFKHLRDACNQLMNEDKASGYSLPRVLWDKKNDAPMTPESKLELLIEFLQSPSPKIT